MSTTERDYYELLGIARDANEADVKRAFRRLARQLHPDVSDEPDAEHRFREVSEAYEVLSNPETRQLYDRFGHAGLRSGGFTPTHFNLGDLGDLFSTFFGEDLFGGMGGLRADGADVIAETEIDLLEAARGVTKTIDLHVAVSCSTCAGSGVKPGTDVQSCRRCGGVGRLRQVTRSVFGEFVRTAPCSDCGGSGRIAQHRCQDCDGAGRRIELRELEVDVPPGIHNGQRIRVSGAGHVGLAGGRAGDLYVAVRVRPDERFVREGNDVYTQVDLTAVEAALGTRVTVETLEGSFELEFEPGTQPGDVKILRGRGMPVLQGFGRGDQRVLVNVMVPRRLSDEQRRLLEEFDRASDEGTYRREHGFFEKLKSAFR